MPFLSKEVASKIRKEIKAKYPVKDGWKFSIRNPDFMGIWFNILQNPVSCGFKGMGSINEFNYKDTFDDEQREFLDGIMEIFTNNGYSCKYDNCLDRLNFSFYVNIERGRFHTPCVVV